MTPEQKLMREILLTAIEQNDDLNWEGEITADNVDRAWEDVLVANEAHYDYMEEFRGGDVETDIQCDYSRHYESKSVAMKLRDGTWIGWTYWYGGGKHGQPEAIDWMPDAYELTCTEEEKLVTVRTFAKGES